MRRRFTKAVPLLVVPVLVLAAAGCGGSKKAATTTTTTTTTTAAQQTTTTTTSGGATSTAASTTPSGLGAIASAANCKQIADLGTAFSAALQGANGNVQKELQIFQQFAAKTPTDIRPDFETIAGALAKIASALKGVDLSGGTTPSPSELAKLSALSQQINSADVKQAEANISAWAAKNCHA